MVEKILCYHQNLQSSMDSCPASGCCHRPGLSLLQRLDVTAQFSQGVPRLTIDHSLTNPHLPDAVPFLVTALYAWAQGTSTFYHHHPQELEFGGARSGEAFPCTFSLLRPSGQLVFTLSSWKDGPSPLPVSELINLNPWVQLCPLPTSLINF